MAATSAAEGTPFARGGPLATSLRAWVTLVFPGIALRRRTVLEAALAGLTTGLQMTMSPDGEAVKEALSSAADDALQKTCYHGCNPRCLAEILQSGLLGSVGKQDIFGVCTSPHIHTAANYPMALEGGQLVTSEGPAVRVILKLRVPENGIIKKIRGKITRSGIPSNFQWPLRPGSATISSIHLWCWKGHASRDAAIAALNIAQKRKLRGVLRDAETLTGDIPPEDRHMQALGWEPAKPAPRRIPPSKTPKGSAGKAHQMLRKKLKRQRLWLRRHRHRIAGMRLPQPPYVRLPSVRGVWYM